MVQEIKGKLKGTAMSKEAFLFKRDHPIKWKIREFMKKIVKKLDPENADLYYPNK